MANANPVSTAFVKQFGTNIMHLVQQKGSRLRGSVMLETGVKGEEVYVEQLGASTASQRTTRHADTPITEAAHERRRVTMFDFEVAHLFDNQDQLKMLVDPTSRYVQAASFALGRSMDDSVLDNATGTAYSGKAGGTSETVPSGQQVAHASTGLTLAKLLSAKEILDGNEADPEEPRFCVLTAGQVTDLLNTTEVKNADYNSVRALVNGAVDTFLGFKFIRTQRCNTDSDGNRQVLCYNKSALVLAIAQDIKTDIGIRRDKSNAVQVYASLGIGSTRLEEEKLVEIACTE